MRILDAILLFVTSLSLAQEKPYTGKFDEPWRPAFHFTPQANWMNDPNGLVYHNGKYHMFYQYYPNDIVWGPMHWGHAESTDLMHWKHLPIALYPDSLGWIFSGSAVIDKNNTAGFGKDAMIAIFTYHNDEIWKAGKRNTESQGIAYSLDEGRTWTKYKGNPVLNNSGEQDFRDPKVFWNNKLNRWTMTLAAGDRIKIYSSADLKSWHHDSDFIPPVKEEYGVWECPDLFPMKAGKEEKWVMILSQNKNGPNGGSATRYFIGDFDGKTFTPQTPSQWFDHGMDFYAAVTFSNVPGDKRILLGWMSNWEYATKTPTSTWRSAMNLPRELRLTKSGKDYRLTQRVVEQFISITDSTARINKSVLLGYTYTDIVKTLSQSNIEFDVPTQPGNNFSIELSNSSQDKVSIKVSDGRLTVDRSRSGIVDFSPEFARRNQSMKLSSPVQHIQLIIDRSSIEIILNKGAQWFSCQLFPNRPWETISIQGDDPLNFGIQNARIQSVRSVWTQ